MRKLILKMHQSIDGFVGGPGGEVDWIFQSMGPEVSSSLVQLLWEAGLHIMGSATYREMAEYWPTSNEPYAPPMNQIPKVAFSRSIKEATWADTRIASGDLAEEIAKLKAQPGKDILAHGGARFAQSLAALNLIDEYWLFIHPAVLGKGLRLFPELPQPRQLQLIRSRPFPGGVFENVYQPSPK